MEFRGQIYNSKSAWNTANNKAHNVLKDLEGYTSNAYASNPIQTTDNKFILVELKGFETDLKDAGFTFIDLSKSIIKIEDI